jgi:hypothetical protein
MRFALNDSVTVERKGRRGRKELVFFALFAGFAFFSLIGCQNASTEPRTATAGAAAVQQGAASTVPHGDHNPHHGGVVMMKGDDLHYEVVLDRTGRSHQVFFTDAVREDLPASIATDVALTIRRPGAPDEKVAMRIDEFGESWVGSGPPVAPSTGTTVRLAFSIRNEPYWIDIPY